MASSYNLLNKAERTHSNESDRSDISSILESINQFSNTHDLNDHDDKEFYTSNDSSTEFFGSHARSAKGHKKKIFIWVGGIVAVLLLGTLILFTSVGPSPQKSASSTAKPSPSASTTSSTYKSDKRLFNMHAWRNGDLFPTRKSIHWVNPAPGTDAQLIDESSSGFTLVNWPDKDNKTALLEEVERSFTYDKKSFFVSHVTLSPDHQTLLLTANQKKNYRHSSYSNFFLFNLKDRKHVPLVPGKPEAFVALAVWSPTSDKVSYVLDNNLYIRNISSDAIHQVTKDGGTEIFYGRPDWVYEEEVFQSDSALWWSPKGDYLAFLRTNDSAVEEFPIPYFADKPPAENPYPKLTLIKYPKPGSPNPIVDLMVLDITSKEVFTAKVESENESDPEKLITEVIWTGDNYLIQRISNRESDLLKIGVFNAKDRKGEISRTVDVGQKDGGWFEISQNTQFVPADPASGREHDGYIDIQVVDGYNHLSYFSPVWSKEPKALLTTGKWEVEDSDIVFNARTNRVYFTATKKSSIERHLYSVNLDGSDLQVLTDESKDGWYSTSFSTDNKFALIAYVGPDVPWQKVIDLETEYPWDTAVTLSENSQLEHTLEKFDLPQTTFSQIKVGTDKDGNDILANAVEHRPPGFDENKKYPVLFYVYGGPISQMVTKKFSYGFSEVVASVLNAVVVTVDGRGTGFLGRDFRAVVRQKLGHYEAQDQITAAKLWAEKPYVDDSRIAIWGWSYGGFMTLKTLEADAGNTFSYGMAVAPVTDWRLYDSIYTERYMKTPAHNNDGYSESAITNVTNIARAERFLIMHGSGDDNVHFQNTLLLLDKFDLNNVENYDMHVFPDSDHSIMFHNANRVVYDKLLHWLGDAFKGKFKHFD
jgi:dipeptidyl aminopeptidase